MSKDAHQHRKSHAPVFITKNIDKSTPLLATAFANQEYLNCTIEFMVGIQKKYDIKKKLSESEKKSVALSIFLDVSHAFESLQAGFPFNLVTDSGFSGEDLVSDLIGFYRAVNPGGNYIRLCQPVRKEIALKIWDTYGPVGNNKNHSTSPYLYPIPPNTGRITRGRLPPFLNTIKPVKEGELYQVVH